MKKPTGPIPRNATLAFLVAALIYGTAYGIMRHKGEITYIEEHSSLRTYIHMKPAESNNLMRLLFPPPLTARETRRLIDKEMNRIRFIETFFGPAMLLESSVREIIVNAVP